MEATHTPSSEADSHTLMCRLERGEIVSFPTADFALPGGDDLALLFNLQLAAFSKNVSYDPATKHVSGFSAPGQDLAEPLARIFATCSASATAWLSTVLPNYCAAWSLDRVTFRPDEEATRRLRQTARDDLLHIDAFPKRPSQGRRILRLFVNVNPTEPRVWITSDPFAKLLERYGAAAGLPGKQRGGWLEQLGEGVVGIFRPGQVRRTAYDTFMLRFHNFLKRCEEFQEHAARAACGRSPPGAVWLVMTDACSHAALRGRFALEHSYFVPADVLALPAEAPAALLERACGGPEARRAALIEHTSWNQRACVIACYLCSAF